MRRASLRRLSGDRRGFTVVEFAIVAPVMMTVILGLGDLLYQPYLQSILDGAVHKAGRDASIESSDTAAIDQKVMDMVGKLAPSATFVATRKSYSSFALVKPENFTDTNGNGMRDPGECFDDVNGNGTWDADPGRTGQGGANDVTLYTMTVTYPRLFPMAKMFGWPATQTITAKTLLKNQPYKTQTQYPIAQVCT